ncbi:phosphatidate cytidylyltransferase [Levilactobacillus parabrevis]|uniref:Phosphatidate cytidylyltransferase n=1 Tax=Levilactobacillus parabrevis ATCC 53295 TaxID=1267003 RepID=A0A0R1GXP6_9LACO|nr:phosphatidate cytidylyltransferase [Levilactobacillus parabrevis]KRK39165.1 CDP-diglyceride synthetase [Levilactobacillus parabrevis ATCC 53295]KRO06745.1 CDP-diglyceride synthetase [Levilactobacillus parabrevis]MCT4488011.1 phosphatidate cytidylyltransferase [Levilactobacillus parabrevis]MCT4489909.1 phosphatidate cytidylyltransferase [Levilactobacillus parabrevis]
MKQRVITAVVALIIFIPIIVEGGIWVDIAAFALGLVALSEVLIMRKKLLVSPEAFISGIGILLVIAPQGWWADLPHFLDPWYIVYLFVLLLLLRTVVSKNRFSFDDAGMITLSMLYIGIGFHFFIAARAVSLVALLYALFIVWTTDSGAYMIGRKLGKHKLAPHISPNKTWEGSIGGSLVATIVGSVFWYFFPIGHYSLVVMIILTLIFSVVGQFGDLVESALKRYYGVKDSGKILPGHGGILDRFDSLLLVLPVIHLFGLI